MTALSELSPEDFARQLATWGHKPSHAPGLLRAYYATGDASGWERLRIPRSLEDLLVARLQLRTTRPAARQIAEDGTIKFLLGLADGHKVESVLMPDYRPDRAAGCLSSQVGCAMGCDFCATAKDGWRRNLTSGEIIEQFLELRREARALGRKLQTLVFMGMGEPLLNLDAVRRMASNDIGGLGWGQVTISTVGIVPGIEALGRSGLNVPLAVSLHAPDDETRARLLPAGRKFTIESILAAASRYQDLVGRPVIIQYCLLRGINDAPAQAERLAGWLEGRRMHVNLLPYNPIGPGLQGRLYEPSGEEASAAFAAVLRSRKIAAHFRRPRGRDIDAACGQLRRRSN